jgi:hypothetical protein
MTSFHWALAVFAKLRSKINCWVYAPVAKLLLKTPNIFCVVLPFRNEPVMSRN